MAAAPLWPYSAGILFLICKSEKSADFSDLLFHGRGRNGKRHLQRRFLRKRGAAGGRLLPLGGAVAQRLRGFKSAEPEKTVKRSSRRTGVNLQFFPVQPTPLGLKGASSPFFVAPARRNRCDLAVLNAQHLLRKPVCDLKAPLGLSCLAGTAALFFSFGVKREHSSAGRNFPFNQKTGRRKVQQPGKSMRAYQKPYAVRGKGSTSRMFWMPVRYMIMRSKPKP